ncbi:MAG: LPS export ABC transporter permease LptG [Alphaproteobacteria bacterium]|nr:LPS export ABC transporter permease LptG [Alphaproteobacteria bacterium]
MRLSLTFSIYIGRVFLFWVAEVFASLLAIIFLFDTIELLRRAGTKEDTGLDIVLQMALFKMPHMAQILLPFAVLFGGIMAFWRLTRSHELIVARATGVSAWQFLAPPLAVALLLALFKVAVFSPFASVMFARFEHLEGKHLKGRVSLLAVSDAGLWLRQANERGHATLYAGRIAQDTMELGNIIVFVFEDQDRFVERIDAESAVLESGHWLLRRATVSSEYRPPVRFDEHRIATELTSEKIQDSFAPPETLSFWDLPGFIALLERAGFSALRHKLYFHSLLAAPVLQCAMVLLAAIFTMRSARRGGTLAVVGAGVAAGFLIYFISDLIFALGMSARLPVTLAAWAPAAITTMLGVAALLHAEDG